MNILFIHHVADMYGASQSLLRITRAMINGGDSVSVVLHENGPLREALEEAGASVQLIPELPVLHRSRLKSPGGLLQLISNAWKASGEIDAVIRTTKPDLIHSNTATILPITGRLARRHGIPFVQHYRESFKAFGVLWSVYRFWLVHCASRIISISDYLATEFTQTQRRGVVRVVRNGIPVEDFSAPSDKDVQAFRAQWKLAPRVVTCIGRINPLRKGQQTLLQAASILRESHPDVTYLLVGSPFPGNEHHLETLKQMITELKLEDRVAITGHIQDIRTPLAASTVSVMASTIPEGLGNVTIESMAMGVPVIGTRIGGTPELIDDGRTGLIIPPSDPQAMANALGKLLDDAELVKQMGIAGRKHFEENLSFEPFYNRIREIYSALLKDHDNDA